MRQTIGRLIVLSGIICIGYAFYAMQQISNAKATASALTDPFAASPVTGFLGQTIQDKVDQYNTVVTWLFIGGTVLGVLGGATLFFLAIIILESEWPAL